MLVAFDFDGTLSDDEMTTFLAQRCGVVEKMDAITQRAMNGEIEYAQSLRERCALLEGLDDQQAQEAFEQVSLREGGADVIETLNDAGVTTAILTGGFDRGVNAALEEADVSVDRIISNRLPVADGELTGEVEGPLIEGTKDDALADLADEIGVSIEDTIAVGDGANDLPMLEVAGLAVGFEPKDVVEPACDLVVESMAELDTVFQNRGVY